MLVLGQDFNVWIRNPYPAPNFLFEKGLRLV